MAKAIIAPHAGYVYSGPIAASAYAHLADGKETVRRVFLLGPAHRVALHGFAASSAQAFATPLGEVPVDQEALSVVLDSAAGQASGTMRTHLSTALRCTYPSCSACTSR